MQLTGNLSEKSWCLYCPLSFERANKERCFCVTYRVVHISRKLATDMQREEHLSTLAPKKTGRTTSLNKYFSLLLFFDLFCLEGLCRCNTGVVSPPPLCRLLVRKMKLCFCLQVHGFNKKLFQTWIIVFFYWVYAVSFYEQETVEVDIVERDSCPCVVQSQFHPAPKQTCW